MPSPEISIIIPCYNVEQYLPTCLDSVLRQSFTDFEVVLVNDGSTDGCESICRKYAQKDSRISVLSQSNQGLSMARNNGLQQAAGKYIYFLDSDDSIHAQLLETVYTLAEKYQADLVSFQYKICGDGASGARNDKPLSMEQIPYILVDGSEVFFRGLHRKKNNIHYNVWTKFYRRELIQGIQFIPKICFEDVPYTYAVLARQPKTVIIDEKLYYYTVRKGSLEHCPVNAQHLLDYQTGINYIYNIFSQQGKEKEMRYLKRILSQISCGSSLKYAAAQKQGTSWKCSIHLPLNLTICGIKS